MAIRYYTLRGVSISLIQLDLLYAVYRVTAIFVVDFKNIIANAVIPTLCDSSTPIALVFGFLCGNTPFAHSMIFVEHFCLVRILTPRRFPS